MTSHTNCCLHFIPEYTQVLQIFRIREINQADVHFADAVKGFTMSFYLNQFFFFFQFLFTIKNQSFYNSVKLEAKLQKKMIKYNDFLFHVVGKDNPEIYSFLILKDVHQLCNQLSILILSLSFLFPFIPCKIPVFHIICGICSVILVVLSLNVFLYSRMNT